jgi:cytochrome c5
LSQDKQFYTTFFVIMAGLAVLAIILVITATSLTSDISESAPEAVLIENIKPVGQVYVAGESEPEPEPAAVADAGAAAEPKSGEEIYNGTCVSCHGTGAAGAPKVGDAAAWAPRIAQGNLLANATNGLNAMPPKGLCMACSEADLQAAIDYMVSQSQ